MPRRDKLILDAFVQTPGQHNAGWRHLRTDAQASLDIDAQIAFERTAKRGLFHAIVIADTLPFPTRINSETLSYSARVVDFEPVTLLSALAIVSRHCWSPIIWDWLAKFRTASFGSPENIRTKEFLRTILEA